MPRFITGSRQKIETICDRHRVVWQALRARDASDPLLPIIAQAYRMAKRMHCKLKQYHEDYDDEWYERAKLECETIEDDAAGHPLLDGSVAKLVGKPQEKLPACT